MDTETENVLSGDLKLFLEEEGEFLCIQAFHFANVEIQGPCTFW